MNFPTKNTLRNSGIVFALILFILFYGLHYFIHNESRQYVLIICLIIIAISLISPYSLSKPYEYWMNFGKIMAKINSNIILGIFFYFVITPFAMIKRLFLISKKSNNKENSYFKKITKKVKYEFKDQF